MAEERTRKATLTGGPALTPPATKPVVTPALVDETLFPLLTDRVSDSVASSGVREPVSLGVLKPLMAGSSSLGRWR